MLCYLFEEWCHSHVLFTNIGLQIAKLRHNNKITIFFKKMLQNIEYKFGDKEIFPTFASETIWNYSKLDIINN